MPAPVAVFAFNRPLHLERTLTALAANDAASNTEVTVFCDGPRGDRDCEACRGVQDVLDRVTGFRRLDRVVRSENLGCANSVIQGVAEMFRSHDRLVVIEDDIVTSPYALAFMNSALERYADWRSVFSIAAWAPPSGTLHLPADYGFHSYFAPRFHCWGWASWRDRWRLNDWAVPNYQEYRRNRGMRLVHAQGGGDLPGMLDAQMAGRIDSWAIRAEYTRFRHGGLTLYPRESFVENIGMDGTGRHCGKSNDAGGQAKAIYHGRPEEFPFAVYQDSRITASFRRAHSRRRIVRRLRRLIGLG